MTLEPSILQNIESQVNAKVTQTETLSGGDSFASYVISCGKRKFFLKLSPEPTNNFICEANGLCEINQIVPAAPQVIAANVHNLILEYLPSTRPTHEFWTNLAERLATIHRVKKSFFGYPEDNFIGRSPQLNGKQNVKIQWPEFFWIYRLETQLRWLEKRQSFILESHQKTKLKSVVLNELSQFNSSPTILHGDLWSGNILCGIDQKAYLIDPAISFGDREADIAMTELFGGFSNDFYQQYFEILPLEKGYERRKVIYNLYHLMNHYNIFGSSYKSSVTATIDKLIH